MRILRPGSAEDSVEPALARALERAPADRFASVKQFAEALLSPAGQALPEESIAVLPFTDPRDADPANEYFSDRDDGGDHQRA